MLVQTIIAVARLIGGDRPVELATFIGYLLTAVLFLPAAAVLSSDGADPVGSVIGGGAALVRGRPRVLRPRCRIVDARCQ